MVLWKYFDDMFSNASIVVVCAPLVLEKTGSENYHRGGAVLRVIRHVSLPFLAPGVLVSALYLVDTIDSINKCPVLASPVKKCLV